MKPIIIFDIEATCDTKLPRNKREIIEIGAIKIVNGDIVDEFRAIVKPKKNPILSTYCKELTHITQEEIDTAPGPKEVLQQFYDWSKGSILACWGEFDPAIIQKEMHKNKITKSSVGLFVNLRKIYLSVKKLPQSFSLKDALKKEHITFEGDMHRAYDDAYNTYLIYKKNKTKMDDMIPKMYSRDAFNV
jgi:inhibitor of KinA sporulation pathway (predicted exonuclease)